MWVDPDDDPRDTGEASPNGELATLHNYLSNYRLTLGMKCAGLDPEQLARRSVPPSTMSLLGLLRHLAEVERDWGNWITSGDVLPKIYGPGGADFDGAIADQTVVDAAYADLVREQAATDARLGEHPNPDDRLGKAGIVVRELLVHRIEEYARHCGHADLLRECVDGRVDVRHVGGVAVRTLRSPDGNEMHVRAFDLGNLRGEVEAARVQGTAQHLGEAGLMEGGNAVVELGDLLLQNVHPDDIVTQVSHARSMDRTQVTATEDRKSSHGNHLGRLFRDGPRR